MFSTPYILHCNELGHLQEDLEEDYPGGYGRAGDGVGTNGGESTGQNGLEDVCVISPMLQP